MMPRPAWKREKYSQGTDGEHEMPPCVRGVICVEGPDGPVYGGTCSPKGSRLILRQATPHVRGAQ